MYKRKLFLISVFLFSILIISGTATSAEKQDGPPKGPPKAPPGPPPAMVVTAQAKAGRIADEVEFTGTVYYKEVSKVSAEVRGKVEEIMFEEGDMVKEGDVLAVLDDELLRKLMNRNRARYALIETDIEKARIDFTRVSNLFKEEFIPEKDYDDARYRLLALTKNAEVIDAELAELRVELKKKTVRAPFDGIIVKKETERGEWMEAGSPVAMLASSKEVDVIVDVPEDIMAFLKKGMRVNVLIRGLRLRGEVVAIIPRGDVESRTFPIKIRIKNNASLIEGMEARVNLPRGKSKKALIVPRDGVIIKFGSDVVFAVVEGKVKMIRVSIVGFSGKNAGVVSSDLKVGSEVVIKGNERLRDGGPAIIINRNKSKK
ncbi:MAG: efflux RND transporter periplasmic adaptor subunit [Thermodesulfobacteriota bacterium]